MAADGRRLRPGLDVIARVRLNYASQAVEVVIVVAMAFDVVALAVAGASGLRPRSPALWAPLLTVAFLLAWASAFIVAAKHDSAWTLAVASVTIALTVGAFALALGRSSAGPEDGPGPGGIGKPQDPPDPPTGGGDSHLLVDWDAFERDFERYVSTVQHRRKPPAPVSGHPARIQPRLPTSRQSPAGAMLMPTGPRPTPISVATRPVVRSTRLTESEAELAHPEAVAALIHESPPARACRPTMQAASIMSSLASQDAISRRTRRFYH